LVANHFFSLSRQSPAIGIARRGAFECADALIAAAKRPAVLVAARGAVIGRAGVMALDLGLEALELGFG
jgi:hypothetical protein